MTGDGARDRVPHLGVDIHFYDAVIERLVNLPLCRARASMKYEINRAFSPYSGSAKRPVRAASRIAQYLSKARTGIMLLSARSGTSLEQFNLPSIETVVCGDDLYFSGLYARRDDRTGTL
jgi:hypothetical protein